VLLALIIVEPEELGLNKKNTSNNNNNNDESNK
jgi:hypothetical protein